MTARVKPPSDLEKRIRAAAAAGEWLKLTKDDEVPAALIADLVTVAADDVHAKGVQIRGATVTGRLDLEDATVTRPLWLSDCTLAEGVTVARATTRTIAMQGCTIQNGIMAFSARIEGNFGLRRSTIAGTLVLARTRITGDLDCTGARLDGAGGAAFDADGMRVEGGVFLNDGFTAKGEVRLLGADIATTLACTGARMDGNGGYAFSADGLRVRGSVFLKNDFTTNGEVRLLGADITGDLSCIGARMDGDGGYAFKADGTKVSGGLFLRGGFIVSGTVCLDHAEVGVLCDDEAGWPAAGNLKVGGFTYGAIARSAPLSAEKRLEWLGRQSTEHYDPQPYEQLAKVLKAQGHSRDARLVLMAKEKERLRRGNVGWRSKLWGWGIAWPLVGFGYAPWRALIAALVVIALGAGVFSLAQRTEVMVPTKERVYMAGKGLPEQYPRFQPVIYSADIFLPIVDLQQDTYWIPSTRGEQRLWRQFVRGWMWFEIVSGWFLTVLFAAGVTGLVKRE